MSYKHPQAPSLSSPREDAGMDLEDAFALRELKDMEMFKQNQIPSSPPVVLEATKALLPAAPPCRPEPHTKMAIYRDTPSKPVRRSNIQKASRMPSKVPASRPSRQPKISQNAPRHLRTISSPSPTTQAEMESKSSSHSESELGQRLYAISKERESLLERLRELNRQEANLLHQLVGDKGVDAGR